MRSARTFCACLCAGIILFGMGRWGAGAQTGPKPNSTAPAQTAAAPAINIPTLDQEGLRKTIARDPANKRPLLLNFWATWCEPCRVEFPDLVKLADEFGPKGLDFAAVSFDFDENSQSGIAKFLKQVNAEHLPVYWFNGPDSDPAIKMVDPEWSGVVPVTFVFDGDGKIVFKHSGRFNAKELRAAVESQMKGK